MLPKNVPIDALPLWLCAGISAMLIVWVDDPPVEPTVFANGGSDPPEPATTLPCRFGRLKVVEPSPIPHVVLIAANNVAYVVLLTAEPSHAR